MSTCYTGTLAGQLKEHVEVVQDPIPTFVERGLQNSTIPFIGEFDQTTDMDLLFPPFAAWIGYELVNEDRYLNFLNNIDEFCELWIAKCPLVSSSVAYCY